MVQAMYSLHGANSMPRFPNMQKQYLNADKLEYKAPTIASKITRKLANLGKILEHFAAEGEKGVGRRNRKTKKLEWIWLMNSAISCSLKVMQ
jgi:hypothetical protein